MDISTKFNGFEVVLHGATVTDYFTLIRSLKSIGPQDITVRKLTDQEVKKIKDDSDYLVIDGNFDITKALSLPILLHNTRGGSGLQVESKEYQIRKAVVEYFFEHKNTPAPLYDIASYISGRYDTTGKSINVYKNTMIKLDILSKDRVTNTLFLSKWFLSQIQMEEEVEN